MEAELFCLNRDVAVADKIARLLRDNVDESITLTVHNVEDGPRAERGAYAWQYVRLLQATIPPSSRVYVSVTTMDWFERRLYLRVYWPMHVKGGWEEVAGTSVYFEGYTVYRGITCFPASRQGLELFFPALALRDRMVLVPRGQDDLLSQVGIPPSERADELPRDILEVDFRENDAVERAIMTLSQRLVAEVRHEVMGYMSVHPSAELDIPGLAAELKVGQTLFERSMKEEASIYELLSFELREKRLQQGRWTKTGLLIRNNSATQLSQVRVTITGPADVEPPTILVDIPPHSEVVRDVSIRASDPGEFPLSVAVLLPHHEHLGPALTHWLPPPAYFWLESSPG